MHAILLLTLTLLTSVTADCKEFHRAYQLAAEWVYPRAIEESRANIGPLLAREHHNCDAWLPADIYPMKVAVRPLYSDSGLPLYDIFEDEHGELIGFEFRTLHIIVRTCKIISRTTWKCWDDPRDIWYGFTIGLTEQEKFLYAISGA